jgi:hypothetical protein
VLLGEVVEGDEVVPVPLQAVGGIGLSRGAELGVVGDPLLSVGLVVRGLVHGVERLAGVSVEPPGELVQDVEGAVVLRGPR